MNRDDILRMAEELVSHIEEFAEKIAAAEREACARVCESAKAWEIASQYQGDIYAAAIRARGNDT